MNKPLALLAAFTLLAPFVARSVEEQALFTNGDEIEGIVSKVYRIPALCTAPNGDLIATCDARRNHGGDLNTSQPINIAIRRSSDGGKTWTKPGLTWLWPWNDNEKWAASDPSLIVDEEAKKVFLFYNVWELVKQKGVYQFYMQESSDNGATWSKPRDISSEIAIPGWPCGKSNGFVFISSGSGIQTKDGTLLHTLVWVGHGNALFGSSDHGKTWKPFGKPVGPGDECKVVEFPDGRWMINSRFQPGGRQIHVSKDRGETWESHFDKNLPDPRCNAQIMRIGKILFFSNCKSNNGRKNMCLRASSDEGATWNEGVCICPDRTAYSDITMIPGKPHMIGVIYEFEGADPRAIRFARVPAKDVLEGLDLDALKCKGKEKGQGK